MFLYNLDVKLLLDDFKIYMYMDCFLNVWLVTPEIPSFFPAFS